MTYPWKVFPIVPGEMAFIGADNSSLKKNAYAERI